MVVESGSIEKNQFSEVEKIQLKKKLLEFLLSSRIRSCSEHGSRRGLRRDGKKGIRL
jgi:hypothetical protein